MHKMVHTDSIIPLPLKFFHIEIEVKAIHFKGVSQTNSVIWSNCKASKPSCRDPSFGHKATSDVDQ